MPGKAPRVAVVEDDSSMSRAITRLLQVGGIETVNFASGESAVNAPEFVGADCLIIDIHLPGMSGFDLFRKLASTGAQTPTIFITAQDNSIVRDEAQKLGAGGYLAKPFTGRVLLDAVRNLIHPGAESL